MNQCMNREQILDCIKFCLENSNEHVKLPICLWGLHGVGKTEIVKQCADALGYNLVVLHLATQDIVDLIGMPHKENGVQYWSTPEWLHSAKKLSEQNNKPNLFFLDEFTRGPRLVLAAMLPFLIEGTLHTHKIGKKDAVIAAANPATDAYEVNELIDEALLNRLGHIVVKPTSEEYIDYISTRGMDSVTIKVLSTSPNLISIKDFDLGFEVKPSRRSIFNIMSIIGKKPPNWIKKYAPHIIEAYLGSNFKDIWLAEYSLKEQSITIDMLKNFDVYENDIKQTLTTEIDGIIAPRLDILSKTIDMIKNYIQENSKKISINDIKWILKLFTIDILPKDASASLFLSNKHIKNLMFSNKECNEVISKFLREKNIITDITGTW